MIRALLFVVTFNSMWYHVLKNGKSIRRFQSKERAILFAQNELDFDSVEDSVAVVNSNGYYIWEF